jgi:hypothetical protein
VDATPEIKPIKGIALLYVGRDSSSGSQYLKYKEGETKTFDFSDIVGDCTKDLKAVQKESQKSVYVIELEKALEEQIYNSRTIIFRY